MPSSAASARPHPYVTEPARLDVLARSGLLDLGADTALDRWTRLAAGLLGSPVALLSLVDHDRQFFKSHVGLPAELAARPETPLSHSFCQHVVATGEPLVVRDARRHPLVRDNGAVVDLGVIAYAGQPITLGDGHTLGAFCVIDSAPRAWTPDELALLEDLAAGLHAELELRDALRAGEELRRELVQQARMDALTGLANRRQLAEDLEAAAHGDGDRLLAVFDLDGFKTYNDTFGHPAGDALLVRMASKLAAAVQGRGTAYRLGGDEFCVLAADGAVIEAAARALCEHGEGFSITNSHGRVHLDAGVTTVEQALREADERLYGDKHARSSSARRQAHDVLLSVLREREPDLGEHVRAVGDLARAVGERLELDANALDELARAAQMHDIGKVAVPDGILAKPGPLDEQEWALMRRHTLLGERILSAAPALGGVATIVRSSHERWDGRGYPDGLAGPEIPLGSRIVFACDAFHAMTSQRPYGRRRAPEEALAELREQAGRQFDPRVVGAFAAGAG